MDVVAGQKLDASAFFVLDPAVACFFQEYTSVCKINAHCCVELCFLYRRLAGLASRCGAAPCRIAHHLQSESHGEQAFLRRLCPLRLSSASAQLRRARTTPGVPISCFSVAVIKHHD